MNNYKYKLSIIVVSYNVRELLTRSLDSVKSHKGNLELETIVVDNASTDGSQNMLAKRDDIELILCNKNLGFAAGNNLGLQHTKGEYILFLNPDTEVKPGALQSMVKFMDIHQQYVALGPKLLNPDGSLQLSVRNFPTLGTQLFIMCKLHNILPRLKILRNYFQLDFNYESLQKVEQIMGAALLVRKWVLGELGGFDAGFKRIYEEVDLCKRIQAAGYRIVYFPEAKIVHFKGASFHGSEFKPSLKRQFNFNHDMLYYFKKHNPAWQVMILYLLQPCSLLLTTFSIILTGLMPKAARFKKGYL